MRSTRYLFVDLRQLYHGCSKVTASHVQYGGEASLAVFVEEDLRVRSQKLRCASRTESPDSSDYHHFPGTPERIRQLGKDRFIILRPARWIFTLAS